MAGSKTSFRAEVLIGGGGDIDFCPAGVTWQRLDTFLVVTTAEGTTGI